MYTVAARLQTSTLLFDHLAWWHFALCRGVGCHWCACPHSQRRFLAATSPRSPRFVSPSEMQERDSKHYFCLKISGALWFQFALTSAPFSANSGNLCGIARVTLRVLCLWAPGIWTARFKFTTNQMMGGRSTELRQQNPFKLHK